MKNHRIYEAIGRINEKLIDDALDYSPKKQKSTDGMGIGRNFSIKRLCVVAAAAVLVLSLTITCVANADGIAGALESIFRREQELIDPYAQVINKENTSEGITVSIDKVCRDQGEIYVYMNLHSEEPFEAGLLYFSSIELQRYSKVGELSSCHSDLNKYYVGNCWPSEEGYTRYCTGSGGAENARTAFLAGCYLTYLDEPSKDVTAVVHFTRLYSDEYSDVELLSGNYRLEIKNLKTAVSGVDEHGKEYYKDVKRYNNSIQLEFVMSELGEVPSTTYYPDIDFELDGHPFNISKIKITPYHIWIDVSDERPETIEVAGYHYDSRSKLLGSLDYTESNEYKALPYEEKQKVWGDDGTYKMSDEEYAAHQSQSYDLGVRFKEDFDFIDEFGGFLGGGWKIDDQTETSGKVYMKTYLTPKAPIALSDIDYIYITDYAHYEHPWDYPQHEAELILWKNETDILK